MERAGKVTVMRWSFCVLLLAHGRFANGQEHEHHQATGSLGTVEFQVSCSSEAQTSFTRGVALLHSFTYEESAAAFQDAAAKDSHCAMAHWGLAMTEYHQLWEPYAGPAELQRGSAEIRQARKLKARTSREKDYVEALGVFYDGWEQRGHMARASAYRDAMRGVHERNAKDQEAAIFYALALVATASPEDKTYNNQRKAAAILEPIFAAQPDHPGVPALSDPCLRQSGARAARSDGSPGLLKDCAELAARAAHAVAYFYAAGIVGGCDFVEPGRGRSSPKAWRPGRRISRAGLFGVCISATWKE